MYKALYRAYRPETFNELLGQEHIVKILKNQLATDKVGHAYLFCGTRGTGKTTTARLLAKGLNCTSEGERPCGECANCRSISEGTFMDVIEIDGASNRKIDDVRNLRESVTYPPMMGKKKVYIIDEVHMLTEEAFNALLKTLEEPPEYVLFILATTDPAKLPATILSRCLRLDFRRVSERIIASGMKKICDEMDIDVTDGALKIIAANADGSVRDGLSILDQCITGTEGKIDSEDVLTYLGASGEEALIQLTDMVIKGRTAEAINMLSDILDDGKDVRQVISDWVSHYRNLLMTRFIRDPQEVVDLSVENIDRIRQQSQMMEPEEITRGIMEISKTMNEARWSPKPRILLELCIVTLSSRGSQFRPGPAKATAPKTDPVPKQAVLQESAKPVAAAEKAEKTEEKKQTAEAIDAAPEPETPKTPEAPETAEDTSSGHDIPEPSDLPDLTELWDQVFADGSDSISSMYLIRSNSMLTAMDEETFTITVSGEMNRKHTENNRRMIEDIMESRTGKRRHMITEMKSPEEDEISVEEAAASAAKLIGVPVEIE